MPNKSEIKYKNRPFLSIKLLNTFSEKEIADLTHFVSCPCFNKDESISRLLEALKRYALNGKEFGENERSIVYEKTFMRKSLLEKVLNKKKRSLLNVKMNNLTGLIEQFLAMQAIKENKSYKCELLYDTLLKRKQYWLLNRHLKKHKKELSKQKEKDITYYGHQSKVEQVILNYLHRSGQLMQEDNLPDLICSLDIHYLLNKLGLQLTALSMRNIPGKKEYDLSSMAAMTPLLDLPQYAEHPLIILYRASVALMETKSDKAYFNLLSLLEQYESVVPISTLKDFYTTTINYCSDQIRAGVSGYYKNVFNLYKVMDTKKLLLDNGFISPSNLKNIVTAACRVKEFVWAEEAIERYRLHLKQSIRDSVYHFNLGVVAFHQKDYETAHDAFTKVDKVDRIYYINTRVLILKCFYEKETDYGSTMQAFRSASRFFKDNRLLPANQTQKAYINFLQILTKIYRFRRDVNFYHNVKTKKEKLESVRKKLEKQKVNADKQWLLEKIEELESGRK